MIINSSPRLPLILISISTLIFLIPIPKIISLIFLIFSLFLLIQSFTLKIKISEKSFDVLQLGKEIRSFPFENWLAWKFILPSVPGFFYFREKASPHLLPILFDYKQLKSELLKKVESLEIK